jgi:hypothetical protein
MEADSTIIYGVGARRAAAVERTGDLEDVFLTLIFSVLAEQDLTRRFTAALHDCAPEKHGLENCGKHGIAFAFRAFRVFGGLRAATLAESPPAD